MGCSVIRHQILRRPGDQGSVVCEGQSLGSLAPRDEVLDQTDDKLTGSSKNTWPPVA